MPAGFIRRSIAAASHVCAVVGMAIIVIEAVWISYGVFVRYVLASPDRIVTEATALLLVPLAFLGLPLALRNDSFPKVDFLAEALAPRPRGLLRRFNLLLSIAVVGFFAIVAANATRSTFLSGASSQVLEWPDYLFWAPVTVAAVVFVLEGCAAALDRDES